MSSYDDLYPFVPLDKAIDVIVEYLKKWLHQLYNKNKTDYGRHTLSANWTVWK